MLHYCYGGNSGASACSHAKDGSTTFHREVVEGEFCVDERRMRIYIRNKSRVASITCRRNVFSGEAFRESSQVIGTFRCRGMAIYLGITEMPLEKFAVLELGRKNCSHDLSFGSSL